ncbi:uncharacterized protein B0H18DRAFT_1101977 [Fomitopsis serialis]|uniref:uncharacterized protein n=1 Tax=Fomitopsis serialis TaxID=139415 RepID=UPI002007740F|nr:uncharacterized protein B0H18DRAFT_1101977 [Neoantrodia serialis]KAH9933936.1 hypothetical protein B0H18DRAFT_1101977 [Neoantrodia serialis]
MAPILASPEVPQSTANVSSSLPIVFQGNKQLLIYVVSVLVAVLLFLSAGVYLLRLRLRRRRNQQSGGVDEETDPKLLDTRSGVSHRPTLYHGCSSSMTLSDSTPNDNVEKGGTGALHQALLTSTPKGAESAPPSLSVSVTDFPPAVLESGAHGEPSGPSFFNNAGLATGTSATSGTPVLNTKRLTQAFTDQRHLHCGSIRGDTPSVSTQNRCPTRRSPEHHESRARQEVAHKGPRADRGESLLDRLDAILAQEPTFVTPEDPTPFPFIAADPTRRSRVMSMLDEIIVQGPPPLSPASEYDSDASSTDSPLPATPPAIVDDHGFLPPLDLASLLQARRSAPGAIAPAHAGVLGLARQEDLVEDHRPRRCSSAVAPAIVLEDTDVGEPPTQTPDCSSLFHFEVSPEMDYLQPPPPSWNAPSEETVQPVYVPRRIVRPTSVRGATPFLKPRRSQLRGQPRPTIGLGLSVAQEHTSPAIDAGGVHLSVPPRAIAAARPAHKVASPYTYF